MFAKRIVVILLTISGSMKCHCTGQSHSSKASNLATISGNRTARINGGHESLPGSWPAQVALSAGKPELGSKVHCGGTLLSSKFVLTAAHCVSNASLDYFIVAGEHDTKISEGNEQVMKVVNVSLHPEYKNVSAPHDVALLELEGDLELNEWVKPALIAREDDKLELGEPAIVVGWGRTTRLEGSNSNRLLQTTVLILGMEKCWPYKSGFVCAGDPYLETGACKGDSGSPLMVLRDGRWVDYAVYRGRTDEGCPAHMIFSKISVHLSWIRSIMSENGTKLATEGGKLGPFV